MKKILIIILFVFMIGYFINSSADKRKTGWIDNNTFRIPGTGYAGDNIPQVERKEAACEAAKIEAASLLILKFAETGISSVSGKVREEAYKNSIKKSFSGIINGLTVVEKKFDTSTGRCRVICEIKEKGMKQKLIKLAKEHLK